jgi:hypothetical protein
MTPLRPSPAGRFAALLVALVGARVAVGAGWLVAAAVRGDTQPSARLRSEGLVAWDGTWYRDIAVFGYDALPDEALRFFPAYPLAARALAWPFGGGTTAVSWALVLVANVAAVGAALLLWRLVRDERGDDSMGRRSAVALTVFPTAFVLVWAYSEALFLVGAIGVLWGVRQQRWWWAAVGGVVAGATRPLGVFLVLPAVVEAVRSWRPASSAERAGMVAAVAGPLVGTGAWLAWVGRRTGDVLYPFTSQEDLRGEAVNPLVRLIQGLGELFGPEVLGDGLHLPFAIAFVALTVVVLRTWPLSYGLFTAAVLLTALAADNLNSLERYALNAFPVVLAVVGLCTTAWRRRVAVGVGVAGIISLSALAWMGIYVP